MFVDWLSQNIAECICLMIYCIVIILFFPSWAVYIYWTCDNNDALSNDYVDTNWILLEKKKIL